ncbi:MAG TPA: hypothetical protein PLZ84_07335, partial [Clostridia bacterium]|nr:hypothetical protein [Clostridia bacterium]
MNNADWLKELRLSFEAVSVYRNIIKDPVVNELNNLIDCLYSQSGKLLGFAGCYSDFFYTLSQKEPTLSLPKYMIYMVLYDENVFTMQAQAKEYKDIDPLILNAAKTDLRLLHKICAVNPESLIKYALEKYNPSQAEKQILLGLPRWDTALHEPAPMNLVDVFRQLRYSGWEQAVERLAKFHYNNGAGIIARYRGFVWRDNKLVGVKNPDNIKLSDL